MKKLFGFILVSAILAGCMHTTCPTYSHYGHRTGPLTAKKGKQPGQTPYYKTVRMAEQD